MCQIIMENKLLSSFHFNHIITLSCINIRSIAFDFSCWDIEWDTISQPTEKIQ